MIPFFKLHDNKYGKTAEYNDDEESCYISCRVLKYEMSSFCLVQCHLGPDCEFDSCCLFSTSKTEVLVTFEFLLSDGKRERLSLGVSYVAFLQRLTEHVQSELLHTALGQIECIVQ